MQKIVETNCNLKPWVARKVSFTPIVAVRLVIVPPFRLKGITGGVIDYMITSQLIHTVLALAMQRILSSSFFTNQVISRYF